MSKAGKFMAVVAALGMLSLAGCTSGDPFAANVGEIVFLTDVLVPPAGTQFGAGVRFDQVVLLDRLGGASIPDRFEVSVGVLPTGLSLLPDREDLDGDGFADPDGARTGHARITGFPRKQGTFSFTLRAIATQGFDATVQSPQGGDPAFVASQSYTVVIGQGSVNIITPTPGVGTTDPLVPATPGVVDFVNPANPSAFFPLDWQVAGGTGDTRVNIYFPRELELSVFDKARDGVVSPPTDGLADPRNLWDDSDETQSGSNGPQSGGSGSLIQVDFQDGG
ncbi:MAG: hypothetical protein ACE10D_06490, partial [Planctomycetota bacterium]